MASSSSSNNNSNIQASGDNSNHEPNEQEAMLTALYWRCALLRAHANALGSRHVLAPIDLAAADESLKIFDVDCGMGSWLVDLASSSALSSSPAVPLSRDTVTVQRRPQHQFVGGRPPQFLPIPSAFPPNISMIEFHPEKDWPEDMHGKFDLANMAYTLSTASIRGFHPLELIARQVALLSPGGWLQVTEMVPPPVQEGEETSAMGIAWGLRAACTDAAAAILHRPITKEICRDLESLMNEAGLEMIGSRDITVPIGTKSGGKADEEEEEAARAIAKGWKMIVANDAKGLPMLMNLMAQNTMKDQDAVLVRPPLPMEELPAAGDRVEQLLLSEGGEQVFRTVWGRKPWPSDVVDINITLKV